MLLWALRDSNPYSYYMLLRWVVCGFACYTASVLQEIGARKTMWALVVVALIYNPFIRAHFSRGTWEAVNVAALAPLGLSILSLWKRRV